MEKLTQEQIDTALESLPEWTQTGDAFQRTLNFPDFVSSIAFVNRVADLAEQIQHHPDILVRYSKVTLTISTHDAGGITEKDVGFAEAVDRLMATC